MTISRQQLEQKIHSTIPQSSNLGYQIIELSETAIVTRAPLDLNINIHNTGFAGSLYSVAALTAWALCYHGIENNDIDAVLVIAKACIDYHKPVESDIECRCTISDTNYEDFISRMKEGQRARLNVDVIINSGCAVLNAFVVATPKRG